MFMPVRSWFRRLHTFVRKPLSARHPAHAERSACFRPFLEALEDRTLLSGGGSVSLGPPPYLGPPTQLVFGTVPTATTAGQPFQVTVLAEDPYGSVVTSYNSAVTLNLTGPAPFVAGGTISTRPAEGTGLISTIQVSAVNGIATFDGLEVDQAGSYYLSSFDVAATMIGPNPAPLTVDPAAATQIVLSGLPSSANAGQLLPFTVTAEDSFGNVDTNYNRSVLLSSSDPAAVFLGSRTLKQGVGALEVFFPSGGVGDTVTATDPRHGTVTGTATLNINSLLFPEGSVIVPQVGVPFTDQVADFTTAFPATASEFTAQIHWGDGTSSAGTIAPVPGSSDEFAVFGSHTYSTITTFLVDVTISDTSRNTFEQTAPSAAVVLDAGQTANLEPGFGFVRTGSGAQGASTSGDGIAADLSAPIEVGSGGPGAVAAPPPGIDSNVLTLFVARYANNPEAAPVDGAIFFDTRVTGADGSSTLTVTFSLADFSGSNPELEFFDSATGTYVPVLDPQGNPVTASGQPGQQFFRVEFNDHTQPTLSDLTGTVFVIAVGEQHSQPGQPTQPAQPGLSRSSTSSAPPLVASSSFAASVLGADAGGASAGGASPVGPISAEAVAVAPGTGGPGGAGGAQPDAVGGDESIAARAALADLPSPAPVFSPNERLLYVTPSQSSITTLTEDDDPPAPPAKAGESGALRLSPSVAPPVTRPAVEDAVFAAIGTAPQTADEWPAVGPLPAASPRAEVADRDGAVTREAEDVWADLFAATAAASARTDFEVQGAAAPGLLLGGLALALATEKVASRSLPPVPPSPPRRSPCLRQL
jgi:hypothetical protein